jgi:pyrroline-5-carboxylate reductase
MSADRLVGIVGTGRLGAAIARRLSPRPLLLADIRPERAAALAGALGQSATAVSEVFARCSAILLALPPDAIVPVIVEHAPRAAGGTLLVNLSTGLDTAEAARAAGRDDLQVVGAKPVAQARALTMGLPAVFVSACADPQLQSRLRQVLGPLGPLVRGDEGLARDVNAAATRHGLRLCLDLRAELLALGTPEALVDAALRGVAVGTILDGPWGHENPYLDARLRELAQEGVR